MIRFMAVTADFFRPYLTLPHHGGRSCSVSKLGSIGIRYSPDSIAQMIAMIISVAPPTIMHTGIAAPYAAAPPELTKTVPMIAIPPFQCFIIISFSRHIVSCR